MLQNVRDHGECMTFYERDAEGVLKIKIETWNTDTTPMQMMGA